MFRTNRVTRRFNNPTHTHNHKSSLLRCIKQVIIHIFLSGRSVSKHTHTHTWARSRLRVKGLHWLHNQQANSDKHNRQHSQSFWIGSREKKLEQSDRQYISQLSFLLLINRTWLTLSKLSKNVHTAQQHIKSEKVDELEKSYSLCVSQLLLGELWLDVTDLWLYLTTDTLDTPTHTQR